jgi:hypothetical protein
MPKPSTFALKTASNITDADWIIVVPAAGDPVRITVPEARQLLGLIGTDTVSAYYQVGATREAKIQAAINYAGLNGKARVFIPTSMLPYTTSAVTFNNAVQMVREGGTFDNYDVRAYGATGNSVTLDTPGWQAAHDAAAANVHQPMYVPPGIYSVSGFLWDGSVAIDGASMDATVLNAPGAGTSIACTVAGEKQGRLTNMTLIGNNVGTTGLSMGAAAWVKLQRVRITDYASKCFDCIGGLSFEAEGCRFFSSPIGVDLTASTVPVSPPNAITFRDCLFSANTSWALRANGGSLVTLDHCIFQANGTVGDNTTGTVKFSNMCPNGEGVACNVLFCWMEDCRGNAAIQFETPANSVALHNITGGHILSGTSRPYGVRVIGATRWSATNVVAQNATTADYADDASSLGVLKNALGSTAALNGTGTVWDPHPTGTASKMAGTLTLGGGLGTGGNVGVGSAALGNVALYVTGPRTTGNAAQFGAILNAKADSSGTTFIRGLDINQESDLGTFTTADVHQLHIRDIIRNGSHTITRNRGLYIESIAAGASNLAIETAGTAGSLLGGPLGVNGATPPTKPTITGSRSGATAAVLAQVLTALATAGWFTDSTTA